MFDVIHDPWIKTDNGTYGIRELLEKSPNLKEIIGENPINEFAIYRFLFVFLMDALQVEESEDRNDILEDGKFDMNTIDAYIEKCKEEGVSFDIFDKEKPFLQECGDFKDAKIKSIGKLNILKPTGTNKRFFDKAYEDTVSMTDDEIARFLVTPTLHPKEGPGYTTCIAGLPIYAIVKGENLFETLVFGIIPIESAYKAYGKPSWRMGSLIDKGTNEKSPVSDIGLLFGLTLPIRRIRVIDNRTMYYEGHFYFEHASWKDPYVPYFANNKKEPQSMKAKEEFYKRWTDFLTLSDSMVTNENNENYEMLQIASLCSSYLKDKRKPFVLITFEELISSSRCTDMRKGDYKLPEKAVGNAEVIAEMRKYATYSDQIASYLDKALYATFNQSMPGIKPYAMQHYHKSCDMVFEEKCIEKEIDYLEWISFLEKLAIQTFDNVTINKLKTDALAQAMKTRGLMISRIEKMKGKNKNGKGTSESVQQP